MKWAQKQTGFTIVELLIVVVVIAILAAITIVAYNGIQNRAKDSSARSASSQAAKKIAIYATTNNSQYPTDKTDFLLRTQLNETDSLSYQYKSTNSNTAYCLTTTVQNISYYTSDITSTPTIGACAGDGLNGQGTITNLITNPSSETTAIVLGNGGGATIARTTTEKYSGNASSLLTKGTGWAYISGGAGNSLGVGGDTVTFSTWVKSSSSPILLTKRGGGVTYGTSTKSIPLNTWTRVFETYTIQAGATSFYVDVGWEAATAPSGSTLYVDASMATSGSTLTNFADGNSPNWIWNEAANSSTSTGPSV